MRIRSLLCLTCLVAALGGCSQQQWWSVDRYGVMDQWYREPLPMPILSDRSDAVQSRPNQPARQLARASKMRPNPRHPWYAKGARPWDYIVVHHSASDTGNAQQFDQAHRDRGWDELGYHFVIDNGRGGPDGRVEVGSRWRKQKQGAHCGGTPANAYNEHGIGICLVGDFSNDMPTPAQQKSLRELVTYLMVTQGIDSTKVITHQDAPNAQTECPGGRLYAHLHGPFRRGLPYRVAEGSALR